MKFQSIRTKLNRFQWRGSFHRNSFILILMIASIPGLITGLGIYWFAVAKVEDELMDLHTRQIEQRAKNMDDQFKYLEYTASQWAFEPRFGETLKNIDFVKQFTETYDISKTLLLVQDSHSLIKKVDLYVEKEKPVLFNSEFQVIDDEMRDFYHGLLSSNQKLFWTEYPKATGSKSKRLAFVHNLPSMSKTPFGSIIVTIDQNQALELLKTLTPYDNGITFLLDERGQQLLSDNISSDSSFVASLSKELKKRNRVKGSFQFVHNDLVYSVSFGQLTRIDSKWTYVSASPMSSITAPLVFVSRLILIFSFTALILALILSWFTSNKIYSPINRLLKNLGHDGKGLWKRQGRDEFTVIEQKWQLLTQRSDLLETRLTEQVAQLKNSFILQLIEGYLYHYSEEDLRKRMESYGWMLNGCWFLAIDFQLTGVDDGEADLPETDQRLAPIVASQLIEEIAGETFKQFHIIQSADLSIGLLLIYPTDSVAREEIHRFINLVTARLNETTMMQVTTTISEETNSIKKIPYLFDEVRNGKRFRIFENSNQLIDLQEIKQSGRTTTFHYPFSIEKEIIQAIRIGQVPEVEGLIKAFVQEITDKGINEMNIQQGIIQLYSSIQHEILHSGIHPHELFGGKNMLEELSQIRHPDRIITWFIQEVICPYIQMVESRLNIELKRVIEKVVMRIQTSYMDDISLESCADDVGTSPYSLSKAFKQIIGINFIDYLTQLRIDKAKELLLNTDMKVNDIAEQVGYRHSYFNRIFKKQTGIPPSQYRKLNQGNDIKRIQNDG